MAAVVIVVVYIRAFVEFDRYQRERRAQARQHERELGERMMERFAAESGRLFARRARLDAVTVRSDEGRAALARLADCVESRRDPRALDEHVRRDLAAHAAIDEAALASLGEMVDRAREVYDQLQTRKAQADASSSDARTVAQLDSEWRNRSLALTAVRDALRMGRTDVALGALDIDFEEDDASRAVDALRSRVLDAAVGVDPGEADGSVPGRRP